MQPIFIDTGPFWDKYPEAEPEIMRYEVRNKDGSVAEAGNHEELLALNGEYAKLYSSQFAGVAT